MRIAVTGAAGHLGRLVIAALESRGVATADIVAIVRNEAKAADLAERGVQVAVAAYEDEAALTTALTGVDRLVLISGSEVGKRLAQHTSIINAAKAAGVALIAYTSLLNADTSTLDLAEEHRATEALLADSGIDTVLLRNGWYLENFASAVETARATGHTFGAAGEGRVSAAARRDYAEAAAAVVTSEGHAGKVYELAGRPAFTYAELATVIGGILGTEVTYVDQSAGEYASTLKGAGLPAPIAAMFAGWDVATAAGALYSDSDDLQRLIGRESTPAAEALAA
ncbi:SDR family oxidoreductase [Tessaracoccus palaemonis]|uniref:SDR family oxidoreductase n=1 Tax=Tessaracoccus palaemonis TaxID=2829499 RepID=A0ABX8SLF5_9ACTN|nr:SDR family oxidoreductase [Tessaracoccus palaemonis]QXT63240.1 SDR family oxidoreductase [Tessaracoccus palaemonis]